MSSSEDDDLRVLSSQRLQAAQQRPTDLNLYQDEAHDESYNESDYSQPSVAGVRAGPHEEGSPGQQPLNDPLQVEAEHSSNPSMGNSSSGSPYPPHRPNKYYGAPSTWRAWTAPERRLAASLDQIRAKDLSIHLYSAFNLKRGYNKAKRSWNEPVKETIPRRQRPCQYRSEWKPPDVWTAWPMTSEEVPREGCLEWEGDETWPFESLAQSSGSVLEDVLASQILRKARHTFQARHWDDKYTDSEGAAFSSITNQSQSRSHTSQNASQVPDFIPDEHQLEPAIMADDAKAQKILQPTIRHLLTKLDDLLRGMHHARAAYGYVGNDPAGVRIRRSTSRSPVSRQQQNTKSERSHSHRSRPSSSSDQENATGFAASPSSTDTEDQRSRATSQVGRKPSARRTKLGLRDWSDILAITSMTGWDLAVIERTASRCSELFGESIIFRTLEEGQNHNEDAMYLLGTSAREAASNVAVLTEPSVIQAESLKGKTLCPIKVCHRSQQGFLKKGDLDDHMRVQHSTIQLSNHPKNNNEGMFGGVHIDGFLQPIQGKHITQAAHPRQRKRKQRHVAA